MSLNPDNKKFLTGEGVKILLEQLNTKNNAQAASIYNDINLNAKNIETHSSILDNLDTKLNEKLYSTGDDLKIVGNLTIAKDFNEPNLQGNLIVQGDLEVKGKTITVDTETLAVKDNFIIINSDNENLGTSLSGIAIKTDTVNAYGIAYDPINKSVSLGQGIITDNNDFSFLEGEKNPILTRAESTELQDGHLLIWDASQNKAVDGGAYDLDVLTDTFATWEAYTDLENRLDGKLEEEASIRTQSDKGLSNEIVRVETKLDSNIENIQTDIVNIKNDISNVDEMNSSISKILEQIKQGNVPYDKLWALSFEPVLNSLNEIIGYAPYFSPMDDGELN